jgi:hypothetical protein
MRLWKRSSPSTHPLAPDTTAAELERLYTESGRSSELVALRQAIARHPNAAPHRLQTLAANYPHEVAQNPALPLILLEQPDFFGAVSQDTLKRLLLSTTTPLILLQGICTHPNPALSEAAQRHVAIAGEANPDWFSEAKVFFRGMPQKDPWGLLELVELGKAPLWLAVQLAGSRNGKLRTAVLALPRLRSLRGLLVRASGLTDVSRLGHAPCGKVSRAELTWLAQGPYWFQVLAARHPKTSPGDLAALAQSSDGFLRVRVARNPSTPPVVLRQFATSSIEAERIAVARNPACPHSVLTVLQADTSTRVQTVLAHRAAALRPGAARKQRRERRLSYVQSLSRRPVPTREQQEAWVRSAKVFDRIRAARAPFAPQELLDQLASDAHARVRRAARLRGGRARGTAPYLLGPQLHELIALHSNPHPDTLRLATTDFDWRIRLMALSNPHLTPPQLKALVTDPDHWVRAGAQLRQTTGQPLDLFDMVEFP